MNKNQSEDRTSDSAPITKQLQKMKLYDLSQPLYEGMPIHQADPPFLVSMYRHHHATRKYFDGGFAYALELLITSMHSGTHIDAPCHVSRNGLLFGGGTITQALAENGMFSKQSIDGFDLRVYRGVLLDVAQLKGVPNLEPSYEITGYDLEKAAEFANVKIENEGAVLIRTGYGKFYMKDRDRYRDSHPGLGANAGSWLRRKKVSVAGTDNLSFDATPTKRYGAHLETLFKSGMYVIKNLFLEELSKAKIFEFPFIVTPLKLLGGTASLVRPIAIGPE